MEKTFQMSGSSGIRPQMPCATVFRNSRILSAAFLELVILNEPIDGDLEHIQLLKGIGSIDEHPPYFWISDLMYMPKYAGDKGFGEVPSGDNLADRSRNLGGSRQGECGPPCPLAT